MEVPDRTAPTPTLLRLYADSVARLRHGSGRRTWPRNRKWRLTPEVEFYASLFETSLLRLALDRRAPFAEMEEEVGGMPGPTMSLLPDSVLLQIVAWLPPRDRLRGARVCKRWHRLVRDKMLWRHLDLTPYKMSSRVMWQLLRNYLRGNLRTLKVQGNLNSARKPEVFSPALMQALGKQCPHLHHLCLAETDLRSLSYDCLPSSLTTLELRVCEIPLSWFQGADSSEASQTFPRLKHLVIQKVPAFADQHLTNIASQGTLKTLVLSDAYRVTNRGIRSAAPQLGDLESLALRRCSSTDAAIHFIARHMKRLRHLDLRGITSVTDTILPYLSSFANLESLLFEDGFGLSPETLIASCQALPRMKRLVLNKLGFDDRTIRQIQAGLPNCVVTYQPGLPIRVVMFPPLPDA